MRPIQSRRKRDLAKENEQRGDSHFLDAGKRPKTEDVGGSSWWKLPTRLAEGVLNNLPA